MASNLIKERTDTLQKYGEYEYHLTRATLLSLLDEWNIRLHGSTIIDVGCGVGGSSQVFYEEGAKVMGLDIDENRIRFARERAAQKKQNIEFFVSDVHNPPDHFRTEFDIAIVRDVLEHVSNPALFLQAVMSLLKLNGKALISFPPYYSAFGGHQHHPKSITRFFPWCHLLPKRLFLRLLPNIGSYREEVASLNKLTLSKMNQLIKNEGFILVQKRLYYIRPSLHFKYGLPIIKAQPDAKQNVIREFLITGAFYLLSNRSG